MFFNPRFFWDSGGAVTAEILVGDGDEVIVGLSLEKNFQVVLGDGDEVIVGLDSPANLVSVLGDGDEVVAALTVPKNLRVVLGDGDGLAEIDTDLVPGTGLYYSKNGVWNRVL